MTVHYVTDSSFKTEVLEHKKLVLVDFWAEWCGPCRAIAPILDQIAASFGDSLKVCKVNIDENPETPSELGVRSIPTLMLFSEGKNVATKVGALPKPELEEWLRQHIV